MKSKTRTGEQERRSRYWEDFHPDEFGCSILRRLPTWARNGLSTTYKAVAAAAATLYTSWISKGQISTSRTESSVRSATRAGEDRHNSQWDTMGNGRADGYGCCSGSGGITGGSTGSSGSLRKFTFKDGVFSGPTKHISTCILVWSSLRERGETNRLGMQRGHCNDGSASDRAAHVGHKGVLGGGGGRKRKTSQLSCRSVGRPTGAFFLQE